MNTSFSAEQSSIPLETSLSHLLRQTEKLELDPAKAENGLAKLVLTVIELLRQLCERQALQRMDSGALSELEIEQLGNAFMRLNTKLDELKKQFDLTDDDLNLDLGPLGRLL